MSALIHTACNDTGWFTVVDLDGVYIEACEDCNPGGVSIPMPLPRDLMRRSQVRAAVHQECMESKHFGRGLLWGLAISAPLWFVIVMVVMWVLS